MTEKECLEVSNDFLTFCENNIKPDNTLICKRVIISRLYYSLYHYCMSYNLHICNDKVGNKHKRLLNVLINKDEKMLFRKLKAFRVLADYNSNTECYQLMQENLQDLLNQTRFIIQRKRLINEKTTTHLITTTIFICEV